MSSPEDRLVWFLADPSLSERDFEAIVKLFRPSTGEMIAQKVREVRNTIHGGNLDGLRPPKKGFKKINPDDPLFDSVERLLVLEANLPVQIALQTLGSSLGFQGQFAPKATLRNGLKRLKERYDASLILSTAQRIRNQVVHHSPDTPNVLWRLKDK